MRGITFSVLFMCCAAFAFDDVEIEQILYAQDKMTAINRVIQSEKLPSELKILDNIKQLIIKNDYADLTQYIKIILDDRRAQ